MPPRKLPACLPFVGVSQRVNFYQDSGLTNEETGSDQRSIDLIDGAAAECYVTSKELRYRRCGGFEVTVRHARAASGHNNF
jgi:hypothetical protein